jgi:predicted nucleic acid-binding protein
VNARYLLDLPVLAETLKVAPAPKVIAWLERNGADGFATSALILAELYAAVEAMPRQQARNFMTEWTRTLGEGLAVVSFDDRAALAYGRLRPAAADGLSAPDAQTAATAQAHDLILATRDPARFAGWAGTAEDPWRG